MKTIEEEWKTIEDFPDYEISNFGRCRHKLKNRMLKKYKYKNGYVGYHLTLPKEEGFLQKSKLKSVGILIAKSFIPNPNGYKKIIYLDGDISNAVFTNIQWSEIPNICNSLNGKTKQKKIIPKEDQLKKLREKIERAKRLEEALINGTENEFIYGELKEEIKRIVNDKFKIKNYGFKEEAVQYLLDFFSDCIHRGLSPITFDYWIGILIKKFYKERKQFQTVEFNERTM